MGFDAPMLIIYSNDGSTVLGVDNDSNSHSRTYIVDSRGVYYGDDIWIYEGSKYFLGVAIEPNAVTPVYGFGDTLTGSVNNDGKVYIVESEKKTNTVIALDINTLNLSGGTHEITVKARASGYVDSAESDAVSVIKNLTGTTWQIPAGWSVEAGYGEFDVYGYIESDIYEGNIPDQNINLGYSFGVDGNTKKRDSIALNWYGDISPSYSFTLSITGGHDVKNERLIAWLKANGELQ